MLQKLFLYFDFGLKHRPYPCAEAIKTKGPKMVFFFRSISWTRSRSTSRARCATWSSKSWRTRNRSRGPRLRSPTSRSPRWRTGERSLKWTRNARVLKISMTSSRIRFDNAFLSQLLWLHPLTKVCLYPELSWLYLYAAVSECGVVAQIDL